MIQDQTGKSFHEGDQVEIVEAHYNRISTAMNKNLEGRRGKIVSGHLSEYVVILNNPSWTTPKEILGWPYRNDGWPIKNLTLKLQEEARRDEAKESRTESRESYRVSTDGFQTNDENWKPGNWLI